MTALPRIVPFLPDDHPFWVGFYFQVQCRNDPAWYHRGHENFVKANELRWRTRGEAWTPSPDPESWSLTPVSEHQATTVVNLKGHAGDPAFDDVVYVGREARRGGWDLPPSSLVAANE